MRGLIYAADVMRWLPRLALDTVVEPQIDW